MVQISKPTTVEGIQKGVTLLSISEESRSSEKTEPSRQSDQGKWVYGYLMTNRFVIDFAKSRGLPWSTNPFGTLIFTQDYVYEKSGVSYRMESIPYRGRTSIVLFFAEDYHKSLENLEFSVTEIDKVRAALDLPEGTKPKWYELNGEYPEDTTFDSDDDIDWKDECDSPRELLLKLIEPWKCKFVDLDEEGRVGQTG